MPNPWRTGTIDSVPCPYGEEWAKQYRQPACGKRNDFRGTEEFLFNQWTGESAVKEKPTFKCDHCGRVIEVVRAEKTIVLSLRIPEP
jgi:hypothetical protein